MENILDQHRVNLATARAREMERRARTGVLDPWWDAPHYVRMWLKRKIPKGTPESVANLIVAMRADPDIPHHFPSTKSLRGYVRVTSKGDAVAVAAALNVWRRYWQWGKRRLSPPIF
jgi:hypothetical protein